MSQRVLHPAKHAHGKINTLLAAALLALSACSGSGDSTTAAAPTSPPSSLNASSGGKGAAAKPKVESSDVCEKLRSVKEQEWLIRAVCDKGVDVNAPSPTGETPLWYVVNRFSENDHGEIRGSAASILLDKGAKFDAVIQTQRRKQQADEAQDHSHVSPGEALLLDTLGLKGEFEKARNKANMEALRKAQERGTTSEVDESINTPLKLAVKKGAADVLELMVDKGARVQDMWGGRNELAELLFHNISGDNARMVAFLLNHGADANTKIKGTSALQHWFNNTQGRPWRITPDVIIPNILLRIENVAFALLRHGANPNETDAGGTPLLHTFLHAAYYKSLASLALEKGADPNSTDRDGNTALYKAFNADEAKRRELEKELKRPGLQEAHLKENYLKITNFKGRYLEITNEGKVALLLEKGAKPDALTLKAAIDAKRTDIVQFLLDKGADVNAVAGRHPIPILMHAISRITADFNGYSEDMKRQKEQDNTIYTTIAKVLIEKGANVNATDSSAETPLMYAASKNSVELVKLLIEKGADVNAVNKSGKTAFGVTQSGKIRDILEAAGATVASNAPQKQ